MHFNYCYRLDEDTPADLIFDPNLQILGVELALLSKHSISDSYRPNLVVVLQLLVMIINFYGFIYLIGNKYIIFFI